MSVAVLQWVGAGVWLSFGVVAVTMLPSRHKFPPVAAITRLLFEIALFAWLGPFAFAIALDSCVDAPAHGESMTKRLHHWTYPHGHEAYALCSTCGIRRLKNLGCKAQYVYADGDSPRDYPPPCDPIAWEAHSN